MRLVIQAGEPIGQIFELSKDIITVGRDAARDVPVPDTAASRNHCQIRRDASDWVIQDSGSRNGTFVNGKRITGPHILRLGDVITVGKTSLRIEESTAAPDYVLSQPFDAQAFVEPIPRQGATLWIALGGVLLGVIVIGVIFVSLILMQPSPAATANLPVLAPTITETPTITAQPTVTLAPTSAPLRVTVAPQIGSVESTATPTATPTPTVTPTRLYLEVFVPTQSNRTKFTQTDTIILRWDPVGAFRPQDSYQVQIATTTDFETSTVWTVQTKDTQIIVSGLPQFNQRYFWRIYVVAPDANGKLIPLSPATKVYDLLWAP